MKRCMIPNLHVAAARRGSTLVIVIAMLGLLSFMGTVFYLFAIQERSAAESFSEAAKTTSDNTDDPFPFALEQLLIGPRDYQKFSILSDVTGSRRHSIVRNLVGPDLTLHTGAGVRVMYDTGTQLPIVDNDYDLAADGTGANNLLDFVDSIAAWGAGPGAVNESVLAAARDIDVIPAPDVDYTAPDINSLFLALKGWAIRDNGASATPRFERIPIIIPSFFRPQYLKSSVLNSDAATAQDVPTDSDWYDAATHPEYQARSFRPHPEHVGGYDASGNTVYRFLEATRDSAILPTAGAFLFAVDDANAATTFGHLGVWTGHAPDDFELDSDNDGDLIKEGIWLDLQAPVQETSGGRLYVTLYSFTIYDLDGLLDLNVVGNLAQLPRDGTIDASMFGGANLLGSLPLSNSNLGLGPNEINPLYAMLPDSPESDVASPYIQWYGVNPSNNLEQANMEWLWSLTGRMENDGTDWTALYPGRWGDSNATIYHKTSASSTVDTLPRPGVASGLTDAGSTSGPSFANNDGTDDNQDSLEGIASTFTGVLRGFVHPIDFAGTGLNRQDSAFGYATPDFRLPAMLTDLAGRPETWLAYAGYSAVGYLSASPLGDSQYSPGRNGTYGDADDLSVSQFFDPLFEDPLEVIMDLDLSLRPHDNLFSVQDLLIGHLVETDEPADINTRLRDVMPSTFASASVAPATEPDRSDRFTTLSNSFRQVPFLAQPNGPRFWEWTADGDGDNIMEFPPQYGTVNEYSAADPFRPEVRRALTIEIGEQYEALGQLLLSANHILDVNRTVAPPAEGTTQYLTHIEQFGLQFRKPIEHPTTTSAASVTGALPTVQPSFPPNDATDQEFWARRDRQKLARDIYVLLYTLGGAEVSGGSIVDYTDDNSNRTHYSEERLRQMAQFAVNMVDAMDTDNVITRFEYDKNLNDGWGLDDLPWTSNDAAATTETTTATDVNGNGLYPEDAINRGVVYGVEAQQLAFSEVLAVHSPDFTPPSLSDDAATIFNDTDGDRHILHVELQNMLPMPVDLASTATGTTNEDQGVWRLARFDRAGASTDVQTAAPTETLTLMNGNGQLAGGDRFTVATAGLDGTPTSADPLGFGTADFYMDADTDSNFNLISPDVASGTIISGATPTPLTNLDLIHTSHDTRWLLSGNSTDRGQFLNAMQAYVGNDDYGITATTGANGARRGFDLVLQRRQNPNLPLQPLTENPWVEVDRVKAEFVELYDITGASAVLTLTSVKSLERHEPLNASELVDSPVTGVGEYTVANDANPDTDRLNTIGSNPYPAVGNGSGLNSLTDDGTGTGVFELWQAHFDREYASAGELLNLPIVGPKLLTRSLDRMRYPGFEQSMVTPGTVPPVGIPDPDLITGAAGMFLQPELPGVSSTAEKNAWYRLMQFVEVPSRVNRMLGNYLNLQRVPGKLNLNMIRHREVYAGLIDDLTISDVPTLLDIAENPVTNGLADGPFLVSSTLDGDDATPGLGVGTTRDRWLEFVNERDGYVSCAQDTTAFQIWLPATPNSRPFRSLGYTTGVAGAAGSANDIDIDSTILRRLALDLPANGQFNAAGEGSSLDVNPVAGGATTDQTNRHWLEPGERDFHQNPNSVTNGGTANMVHRHQFLSKIMNNTTTVSNCFIVFGTAAYFEAVIENGVARVGGRMGLDLDNDLDEQNDAGWEKRAVFVIDRTETFNGYDPGANEFEWERLVKHRLDLESDGQ